MAICDGCTERGIAAQNGDANLELVDLAIEVSRREPLARQFVSRCSLRGAERAAIGPRTMTRAPR